jgi:hypothetical protein
MTEDKGNLPFTNTNSSLQIHLEAEHYKLKFSSFFKAVSSLSCTSCSCYHCQLQRRHYYHLRSEPASGREALGFHSLVCSFHRDWGPHPRLLSQLQAGQGLAWDSPTSVFLWKVLAPHSCTKRRNCQVSPLFSISVFLWGLKCHLRHSVPLLFFYLASICLIRSSLRSS